MCKIENITKSKEITCTLTITSDSNFIIYQLAPSEGIAANSELFLTIKISTGDFSNYINWPETPGLYEIFIEATGSSNTLYASQIIEMYP